MASIYLFPRAPVWAGLRNVLTIAGLGAIILPVFLYHQTTRFPGLGRLALYRARFRFSGFQALAVIKVQVARCKPWRRIPGQCDSASLMG